MKKLKTYGGENFKNWYCKVDINGDIIRSKQYFIGTLGGFINLIHKSDLGANCYKWDNFKAVVLFDLSTIEIIAKQQAFGMAERELNKIPPRMLINEYWDKNTEIIKKSNPEIFQ